MAFIAQGAADQHIYVRRLDELESRQVAGTEGARDLAFSPDGGWLVFHSGNRIRKVSLSGGSPTALANASHSHGLAWHPTEDAIYFAPTTSSAIWKVPAGGGSPVAVTQLDQARGEHSHEWPLIAGDGHTLLFSVNAGSADLDQEEVSLFEVGTGARQNVRTGGDAVGFTDARELLFVRDHSLMSAPYDSTRHVLASGARELVAGVLRRAGGGSTVELSGSGTLAYRRTGTGSRTNPTSRAAPRSTCRPIHHRPVGFRCRERAARRRDGRRARIRCISSLVPH